MSEARKLLEELMPYLGYSGATGLLIKRIEAELEKPESEPVGIITDCKHNGLEAQLTTDTWNNNEGLKAGMLLYTHPPAQQKPLSDDEIKQLWEESLLNTNSFTLKFSRAIEQAHGIK